MPLISRAGDGMDSDALLADALRRVRRLEKRTPLQSVPFSFAGALALSTSPPWASRNSATLFQVLALLGTSGTSNTVVTVYKNGSSVGTVTLGSGVTNNAATLNVALSADSDVVTVGVTTVGSGAADLTVLVRVA